MKNCKNAEMKNASCQALSHICPRQTTVSAVVSATDVVVSAVATTVPHLQFNPLTSSCLPTHLLWTLARGERSVVGCVQSPDVVLRNLPALALLLVDPIRLALTIGVDRLEGGKPSEGELLQLVAFPVFYLITVSTHFLCFFSQLLTHRS